MLFHVIKEVRNFTADVLTEVCYDVHVEPHLQLVSEGEFATGTSLNTSDGARLDIAVSGFWEVHVDMNEPIWM